MAKRRVVLTGASGYVAQRMFPELSERWDLVPIDVRPTTRDGKPVPGIIVADLTNPDRNAYRQLLRAALQQFGLSLLDYCVTSPKRWTTTCRLWPARRCSHK